MLTRGNDLVVIRRRKQQGKPRRKADMSSDKRYEKVMKETGNTGYVTMIQSDVRGQSESEDRGRKKDSCEETAASVVLDVAKIVVSVVLAAIVMKAIHRFTS
jgi:hypothetical protein